MQRYLDQIDLQISGQQEINTNCAADQTQSLLNKALKIDIKKRYMTSTIRLTSKHKIQIYFENGKLFVIRIAGDVKNGMRTVVAIRTGAMWDIANERIYNHLTSYRREAFTKAIQSVKK